MDLENNYKLLLENLDKVSPLQKGERGKIVDLFKPLYFKRNEFLLEQGKISKYEYFIVSGSLRMYIIDQNDKEQTLRLGIKNWWSGDLKSFINKEPSTYNIQAISNTNVLAINKTNWDVFFSTPEMANRGRIMFQNAVIALHKRTIDNLSLTAQDRYQKFLKTYPKVHNHIPLKYIASYLGITPEFLSNLRKKSV